MRDRNETSSRLSDGDTMAVFKYCSECKAETSHEQRGYAGDFCEECELKRRHADKAEASRAMLSELGFSHREIEVIEELATQQELTVYQVLQQGLRQYQSVCLGLARLERTEPPIGCPPVE